MYITSQVLVSISDVIYILSMFTKKKLSFMIMLFISDILFSLHFFFLSGGLTGAIVILFDAVYLAVMYFLEKFNKTKYNLSFTLCSIVICVCLSLITWQGALSLLPMFAMVTYLIAMIFKNIIVTKLGSFSRNLFNVIYMFIIGSYLGAWFGVAIMISAVVGIIIGIYQQKKSASANIENKVNTNENSFDSKK